MSVKLGRYKYIATQGPCPEGFHIPLYSEWRALYNIFTGLGFTESSVSNWSNYFKMPYAGYRNGSSNISSQGNYGAFWSSTYSGTYRAYVLQFNTLQIGFDNYNRINGYSIRPFYNEGIAPNGGWQVLYQGTGSAGIYWHKDLGLITASGDGVTWITIADKNLGATTVYNSGDTLSEENCGGYFQWGNNHMFPFTGTVTTSSTQVDASSYGPGNRYDSSTFITRSSTPYDWSSVRNNNLWGWANGNVWKDVESIGGLPHEYQEVEYIESTGTQYIDIGYKTNINLRAEFGILQNTSYTSEYAIFGDAWAENAMFLMAYQGYFRWHFSFAGKNVATITGNKTDIKCDRTGIEIDGTKYDYSAGTSYSNNNIHIFNSGDNSNSAKRGRFKLYYFKLYDDSQLVRDFVPCYRVSDGTIGLYDLVEGKFYTNSGTGTFTKGNDTSSGIDSGEHQLDEHSMFPQGPCPDGFHVPTKDEWDSVYSVYTGLGLSGVSNWMTYLKMPYAGYRPSSTSNVSNQGNYGAFWSSTYGTTNGAFAMGFNTSQIYNQTNNRGNGHSIRPFKNFPVKPDSSWTTLYQGSGSAGIFHNPSLGLISISSSGATWITIADKNLGATTVWNSGNSLSEANCGKYYQWGNNYGFPWTGSVTTSTTQVDASGYGPGNYYSSSTFIIRTSSPYGWDSSNNEDLWGGVSKSELKQYYSFNLLNEYIGEYHECEVNTMGPCPSGFHIPTRQEWYDLYDIGYALGLWDTTNYGKQLQLQFNMPVCGKLNNDGTYTSSPTDAVYWCADKQSSSYGRDVWLRTTTDVATIDDDTTMIRGGSIRPFRNMPLIPTTSDSNWSIPTGSNPANGGIYDNETEGVISISADGAHWMTLADKNCGATTKWYLNSTMSESNCGKFYQWGNNHGFPFTGATKTSSTAVDASDYGPFSEYYDDDTFITTSPWDTSDNRNLWGGVSGPTRNCDISGGGSLGPSTVVCDFRSGASGEATPYSVLVANNNFVAQRSGYNSIGQGNNGTLRLKIPSTDYAGAIKLGGGEAWGNWISNAGYSTGNTSSWNTSLKQNLIKKAYLTVSAISSTSYPNFGKAGVYIDFCKKVESSNISNGSSSVAGFVFPRSNYGSWSGYQLYPSDVDVKYLVLPSTPNIAWNGTTCSDYINQGVSSIGSKVIIETRGSSPSDLHYWLTIEVTGNEYDLGLCSDLGACSINVECGDWWQVGRYKEISEAYLEMYDSWYIDADGNITDTKPW